MMADSVMFSCSCSKETLKTLLQSSVIAWKPRRESILIKEHAVTAWILWPDTVEYRTNTYVLSFKHTLFKPKKINKREKKRGQMQFKFILQKLSFKEMPPRIATWRECMSFWRWRWESRGLWKCWQKKWGRCLSKTKIWAIASQLWPWNMSNLAKSK